MTQDEALDILKTGVNVFLTGQAGTGKTYVLNKYIEYLKRRDIGVAVTASTGIAASHIDGKTIHSWAGIGINDYMTDDEIRALSRKRVVYERFHSAKVLIIDEISMLHSYRLDLVNAIAKMMHGNFDPFGGMQIIFCGDFFQLPPVSPDEDPADYFAFKSNIWREMDIKACYLEKQYRQTDQVYLNILNKIRNGTIDDNDIKILLTRYQSNLGAKEMTRLYTHNENVDAINARELSRITVEKYSYTMQDRGPQKLVSELKKNCLAKEEIVLKKGAVVMFIKNNFERGYVNGTLGIVIDFDDSNNPMVRTRKGNIIVAIPESWRFEDHGVVLAEITQIPLCLAWAITVHKSQGFTLDAAEIDLSQAFEPGMGYVALSRIKSLDGLRLMGINDRAIEVSEEIKSFDAQIMKLSDVESNFIRSVPRKDIEKKHLEFIKRVKPGNNSKKSYSVEEMRRNHTNAYAKWTETDDMLLKKEAEMGKSVKEMASFFGRNTGAIRSRLDKLGIIS